MEEKDKEKGQKADADFDKKPDQKQKMDCQERVEYTLDRGFEKWAGVIVRNPCKVFWFSFLFFFILAMGNGQRKEFEDEQEIWTPRGNPSVLNNKRQKEIFDST